MQSDAPAAPLLAAKAPECKITVLHPLNPHFDYFAAILPETPVVCGLRLKPLSIGRYRTMARFKVAFVAEQECVADWGDLLFGVLICSSDCDEFALRVADSHFHRDLRRWSRRFGFVAPWYFSLPFVGRWLEKRFGEAVAVADGAYITEQIGLFQKYISDGSPDLSKKFWNEPSDNGQSGTHWSQNIEAVLREHLGWTKQEIDEEPLAKGLWDFYKHLENAGIGRFMSPEEIKEMERQQTPEEIKADEEWAAKLADFLKTGKVEVQYGG